MSLFLQRELRFSIVRDYPLKYQVSLEKVEKKISIIKRPSLCDENIRHCYVRV